MNPYMIVLFTYADPLDAGLIKSDLENQGCKDVDIITFSNGVTVVTADLTDQQVKKLPEKYLSIRTIEPNREVILN